MREVPPFGGGRGRLRRGYYTQNRLHHHHQEGAGTLKTKENNHHKSDDNKKFRIDWQGYNADDPAEREERTDVSPAGTEGIFIDPEAYKYD